MKLLRLSATTIVLFLAVSIARGQSPITTLTLGPDQIGSVRTAQGITTRISFPRPVKEIICGDLYESTTGKGAFVIARSGDDQNPGTDIYLKPVVQKGVSNLFVRTIDGKQTYNFDLNIVPSPAQAHRVVNVFDAPAQSAAAHDPPASGPPAPTAGDGRSSEPDRSNNSAEFERLKAEAEQQARQKAGEIIRNAQQQADRKIAEAEAKFADAERAAAQRGDQEADHRFVQALMLGIHEVSIKNSRVTVKKITMILDPSKIVVFGDRAYLRYTMQNSSDQEFTFGGISIEAVSDKEGRQVTIEVNQSKLENKLAQGESLTGVLVFDAKQLQPKDRVALYLRAEDKTEIGHITLQ